MDSRTKIVFGMYEKYAGVGDAYFEWTQGKKLAAWIDLNRARSVTVIGHSYGGATAIKVVAKGHFLAHLITVDPVGWFRPGFGAVVSHVDSWTNYNAVGTGINWPNFVAAMGGAYNDAPKNYSNHYDIQLNHVDICYACISSHLKMKRAVSNDTGSTWECR